MMSLTKTHLYQLILSLMSRYLSLILFIFFVKSLHSQDVNEDIKTQQIVVSKSYVPELTNINKIRSIIASNDLIISKKVTVTYELIETPVISSFKPNKASPLTLKRNKIDDYGLDSFIDLGIGSKDQLTLDYTANYKIDRSQSVGLDITSLNYGQVDKTIISSDESRFIFGINHIYSSQKMEVIHSVSIDQHNTNYYGIDTESTVLSDPLLLEKIISGQKRKRLNVLSNWRFYNTYLKGARLDLNFINDSYKSQEKSFEFKLDILIPVFRMNLLLVPKISYLNSSFNEDYFERNLIKSSYTKFESLIQIGNVEGELKYQFGARINYLLNKSNRSTDNFFVSPKLMIYYTGAGVKYQPYIDIDGGVKINSYSEISNINPYVAPSLNLVPTENSYNIRFGFKSFFDSGLEFNFGAHYKKEKNSIFFNRYAFDPTVLTQGYKLANSFGVQYDNLIQYGLFGELLFNFNEENLFKFILIQNKYDLDNISHPWNLPGVEGDISLDLKVLKKLRINVSGRYIGTRPSVYRQVFLNQLPQDSSGDIRSLPSLTQLKTEVNYKLASRWIVYMRSQFNIGVLNSKWDNYLLNKNLFLIGTRYGFDLKF